MRKILGCFIFIMIMITSQIFAGTVYYVDSTNGNDFNSGTSPEAAWKTINKVNNSSFNPGDAILFKRGETWREQLIVPSSGSPGNPITFGAYGTGADPIISAADLMSGWTLDSGNIWKKTGVTTQPYVVVFDGIWGEHESGGIESLNANYEWYWADEVLYVYTDGDDPDTQWPSGIDVAQRDCAIVSIGKDYITFDGLDLKNVNMWGVRVWDSEYNTVQNCTIKNVGQNGVTGDSSANHLTVSNCTISYMACGINISDSDNNTFEYNDMSESRNTAAPGGSCNIALYNSDSNIMRYNYIHDAKFVSPHRQGDGFFIGDTTNPEQYCNDNEIYYNIVSKTNDGIDISGDGNKIYNNIFYDNQWPAYHIGDTAAVNNNIIRNNIFYENITNNILVNGNGCGANNTIDYNCYYDPDCTAGSGDVIGWTADGENWETMTWNAWIAHGKYDQHSIYADPLFVDGANHNFHLKMASPCVDKGTDVSLTQDYDGNTVPNGWAVDIGAYEYQGSVSPPLSAEINASPTSGYVPLAVSFTASASGGTAPYSYSWDFGDGQSSSDQNPSHTYSSAGTYTVTLTVTDSSSSQATDSLIITATSPSTPLSGSASASTTSGEAPLTVNFTGSASGGTSPYTYSWNFSDGQSSSSQNPAHTYSSAGNYIVIFTVTDSKSSTATDSLTINVQEKTSPLQASASASPTSGQVPLTVSFTGSASGGTAPYSCSWNFGDGSSSSSQNPSHTYSSAGTYTVILTVTDSASSQASASTEVSAQAHIPALAASCTASPISGDIPLTVNFTGTAAGGISPYAYSWDFGDGSSSSTTQNPSHTYTQAGSFTVTFTVTDSTASQATDSLIITATSPSTPLSGSASASTTSGEAPLTVNFTGSASGGTSPYTYSWNFGDGSSSSSQNPSHTYSAAGDYTATLTVIDSASNQDSESVTIDVSAPHTVTTPNTPSGPSNGSPSVSYAFTTGGSSCSHGHSIEYRFDWGDESYSAWSTSTSASHSWPADGIYTVKAQARCSVNHSIVSGWSSEITVTIATSSYFNLAVSSATGSPTPGQGGTTDPLPGNHSYSSGSIVQLKTITNTDYRFSKWTGDVSSSDTYNEEITVSMDNNKSISAYFCTKCGDVNGDLNITPADAQEVFEIFLGIISDPTDCQKENADVNCDGTKTDPKITPGDAQAIFEKFLGINNLPGDCSCKSRAESAGTLATQERAFVQLERSANINLIINDIKLKPGNIIAVPIIIDNPSNIKAFGFDILFESEILEFVGVMRTELLKDFNEVDGNEIAQGVLRVGGYSSEPIRSHSPGALIRLIFKVTGETEEPCPFLITNTVDDLENASFQNRTYMRKKIRRKDIVF